MRAAQLATAIGALTVAEEAIGHVPRGGADIEKVAADVEMTRQRVALPPGAKAGVPPTRSRPTSPDSGRSLWSGRRIWG